MWSDFNFHVATLSYGPLLIQGNSGKLVSDLKCQTEWRQNLCGKPGKEMKCARRFDGYLMAAIDNPCGDS